MDWVGRWDTAAPYTRRIERYYLQAVRYVLHVVGKQQLQIILSLSAKEEGMN
jgi:hypothetical protein